MYYGNEVAPLIESFLDNAAKDLTGNEVAKDLASYYMGYFNGAYEMARLLSKEIFGWDVRVSMENDGRIRIMPNN